MGTRYPFSPGSLEPDAPFLMPMSFSFVRSSKYFLTLSALLVAASAVLFIAPGPQLSIEFTGGTLMELRLPTDKTEADLEASLASFSAEATDLTNASVTSTRDGTYFVRTPAQSNDEHLAILAHVGEELGDIQEVQYTTIGPTVGASLKQRAIWALIVAAIAIILYIAIAFRKIPRQLSPLRFGVIAIVALLHDILITVGIFTILSHYTTFQMDTLFISALLSIMGYSVNDTIVIFDRIRDNLLQEGRARDFAELADRSLRQTLTRTVNTGLGAMIMLAALFILGSESIRWFVLTLIIGTIIGTYSSFFIATPLLVYWKKK